MEDFSFFQGGVVLHHSNGLSQTIYFNANSGKLYWRYKIDTLTNVKHPCVYLGRDAQGRDYVVHNHYHYGSAFVDTWQGFAKGQAVYDNYLSSCKNPPKIRIQNALNQVIRREPYDVISYNCQTTVNLACNNEQKSQSINNSLGLIGGIAAFALLFLGGTLLISKD